MARQVFIFAALFKKLGPLALRSLSYQLSVETGAQAATPKASPMARAFARPLAKQRRQLLLGSGIRMIHFERRDGNIAFQNRFNVCPFTRID